MAAALNDRLGDRGGMEEEAGVLPGGGHAVTRRRKGVPHIIGERGQVEWGGNDRREWRATAADDRRAGWNGLLMTWR